VIGPFDLWREARRVWSIAHGNALGDWVDRLQHEVTVRRALSQRRCDVSEGWTEKGSQ
jgi:hypothetical protein